MLVIRLRRIGKKNKPTYRVVVAEHSYPINGKFTADLGFYNPHTKGIGLKLEDIKIWLSKGAKPSNTVAKLLINEKVKHASIVFEKRNRKPKNAKPEETTSLKADETTPATEEVVEGAQEAAETTTETETAAEEAVPATDEPVAE